MTPVTRSTISAALASAALLLSLPLSAVAAPDETVVIRDTLRPAQLEIDPGTTVTWRNRDDERHRLRSKDGPVEFDSKNLEPGDSFSFTFNVEGSYPYYDHRDRDDAAYFGMITVGGAAPDPDAPLPETGGVSIIDKSFQPGSIAIAAGGTVEWRNDDGEAHTVTAIDESFDSGIINGGASFSQTFAAPGDYPYFCLIHPEMRGSIRVSDPVDAPATEPTDEEGDASVPIPAPDLGAALEALGPAAATPVSIVDRSFAPEAIEVVASGAVTWSNDDTEGHTVTAVDGSFDSGIMTIGDEFSLTFEEVGSFDYFCAIHPEMTGTVTVSEPGD